MLFNRKNKKKSLSVPIEEIDYSQYERLVEPISPKQQVVEACEQIIDAAREFEDAKDEYALVTNYLMDIQRMDELSKEDRLMLEDAASNIFTLNGKRNEFLNTKNEISDSQFAQLQEMENDIPKAIRRLSDNERYLDAINRDLHYLEAEKLEMDIQRDQALEDEKHLRIMMIPLSLLFVASVVLCILCRILLDMDTTLILLCAAFVTALAGTYVFIKHQECERLIKSAALTKNQAIMLENRVKIKYVNMKNAVDYSCEKYHVRNSREFNYNYEKYQEMVRDRQRFQKTNDELEINSHKLIHILQKNNFYDAKVWLNYTNAIVDPREMVELKHNLIVRRQKLRGRMQYNVTVITQLRSIILTHRAQLGDRIYDVNKILEKIAELDMEIKDDIIS